MYSGITIKYVKYNERGRIIINFNIKIEITLNYTNFLYRKCVITSFYIYRQLHHTVSPKNTFKFHYNSSRLKEKFAKSDLCLVDTIFNYISVSLLNYGDAPLLHHFMLIAIEKVIKSARMSYGVILWGGCYLKLQ